MFKKCVCDLGFCLLFSWIKCFSRGVVLCTQKIGMCPNPETWVAWPVGSALFL